MKRAFITGSAGFIGFHLAELLLQEGWHVAGYDGMTDYYDVTLKQKRHAMLGQHAHFTATEALLEDAEALSGAVAGVQPDIIVHLAAQAGVRYLFRPQDSEDLARAFKRFLALSPGDRRGMGQAGRKFMEDRFDEQLVIDAYKRLLQAEGMEKPE